MGTQIGDGVVAVSSLAELDALVGKLVMNETPSVHWEDSYARFRFESLEEALDAMQDPVIQSLIPDDHQSSTVLQEVREFRPYSSMILATWEVVEQLRDLRLHLRREGHQWLAAFGDGLEVAADSVSVAISLAALRANGLRVELTPEFRAPVNGSAS